MKQIERERLDTASWVGYFREATLYMHVEAGDRKRFVCKRALASVHKMLNPDANMVWRPKAPKSSKIDSR